MSSVDTLVGRILRIVPDLREHTNTSIVGENAVIKRGVPPTMMAGFDGRIPDDDLWSIVNYLRTLGPKRQATQSQGSQR